MFNMNDWIFDWTWCPPLLGREKFKIKRKEKKSLTEDLLNSGPFPPLTSTIQFISPQGSKSLRKIKNIFCKTLSAHKSVRTDMFKIRQWF
jgi:hypothetical protein